MEDIFHFVEEEFNSKKKMQSFSILGTRAISSLAPKIWELVPNIIKNATSLELLKKTNNALVGFVKYT